MVCEIQIDSYGTLSYSNDIDTWAEIRFTFFFAFLQQLS